MCCVLCAVCCLLLLFSLRCSAVMSTTLVEARVPYRTVLPVCLGLSRFPSEDMPDEGAAVTTTTSSSSSAPPPVAAATAGASTRFPPWVKLPAPSSSSSPPLDDGSGEATRRLVLDYLAHSTYVDSAVAFVRDWERERAASPSLSASLGGNDGLSTLTPRSNRAAVTTDDRVNDNDNDNDTDNDTDMQAAITTTAATAFELDVDDVDHDNDAAIPDSPLLPRRAVRLIRVRRGQ